MMYAIDRGESKIKERWKRLVMPGLPEDRFLFDGNVLYDGYTGRLTYPMRVHGTAYIALGYSRIEVSKLQEYLMPWEGGD